MPTKELRSERFMHRLLAASDDCIKVLTMDGKLAFMSEGGQRTMEVSDFNAVKGCPWPDFWEGDEKAKVKLALAEASAGRSSRFQGLANTAAGRARFWDVQVSPIFGPDGRPESILSVSRDITTLKETEDRLRLLADELQHRMRNMMAIIQAIANQTIVENASVGEIKTNFSARLEALNAAQSLLTEGAWNRAPITGVVQSALRPHAALSRFRIRGPEVQLSSKCALGLALGLHELATNATKYGALRNENGHIDVRWSAESENFQLNWQEKNGPPVLPPTHTGFGTKVVEKALAGYFSGKAIITYKPTGLEFELSAPMSALTAD